MGGDTKMTGGGRRVFRVLCNLNIPEEERGTMALDNNILRDILQFETNK